METQAETIEPQTIGKYTIVRRIARTNLSEVYAAKDPDGEDVCVKRLLPEHAKRGSMILLSFRREATLLAEINHPNVLRVIDVGEENGVPFMCVDLIEGASLDERIARETISVPEAIDLLCQIARGLVRVHERGIVHADIKPANVLLDVIGDRVDAKLADFGLAADSSDSSLITGTPHYMAPEQTGLVDWPIDARSDLYSVGISAFELLTKTLPFDSDDIAGLMKMHVSATPPRASDRRPDIPPLLDRMIQKLLEKNPADRYRSAAGLLHDLERLVEAIRSGDPNPEFPLDASGEASQHLGQVFVGRTTELAILEGSFSRARQTRTEAIFVGGVAGVGKSALLREFQNRSITTGARFASGKCYPFARGLPYYVLSETLTDFLKQLSRAPAEEREATLERLRAAAGDLAAELVKIAPSYASVFPDAGDPVYLGEGRDRLRFLQLMGRVFAALAPPSAPLVLFLDDLQWADLGTLDVLESAIDTVKDCSLLILATYRAEEVGEDHPLQNLLKRHGTRPGVANIELAPFDLSQTTLLIAESLRQSRSAVPASLAERVHARTEGNPLFVTEVLKALLGSGALRLDVGELRIDQALLESTNLPGSIIDFVLRRIEALDERTQMVLGCAALLGKGFRLDLLSEASDLEPEICFSALQQAQEHNLLQPPREGVYRFHHDRVREACLGVLDEASRRSSHTRVVVFLEETNATSERPDAVFDLAEHASNTGSPELAWRYCVRAAELAQSRYANDQALIYYRRALDQAGEVASVETRELNKFRMKLAQVLDLLGRYKESSLEYERILETDLKTEERADLLAQLASSQGRAGNPAGALEKLTQALKILGVRVPEGRMGSLIARARYWWSRLGGFKKSANSTTKLACDVLSRIYILLVNNDARRARYVAYEMLARAATLGPSRELSLAHRALLVSLILEPRTPWETALGHGRRSAEIARSLDLHLEAAVNAQYTAQIMVVGTRYREGLAWMKQTREQFSALGNMWELANVHIFSCIAHRALGEVDEAIAHASALITLGERIQALGTISNGNQKLADLLFLRGDNAKAESHLARSLQIAEERKLNLERFQGYKILGSARTREHRYAEARAQYASAIKVLETPGVSFLPVYVWDAYFGQAEAILKDADYFAASGGLSGEAVIGAARDIERGLARERWLLGHLAHGYRAKAHLEWRRGRFGRSRRLFEKSMKLLVDQDRPVDLAFTQLDAARALQGHFPAEALPWLRRARAIFADRRMKPFVDQVDAELVALGYANEPVAPTQQASRDDTVLKELVAVGLMLRDSRDPDLLLERILEASLSLIGAERGFIFLRESGEDELQYRLGKSADGQHLTEAEARISKGVIKRVDETGRAIAVSDITRDEALRERKSVTINQLRSIVCAPLEQAGNRIGALYLDTRMTEASFEKDDLSVLESFAAQAASALANALQFRTITTLNAELDAKVLDRTRQLEAANAQLKATIDEVRNTTLRLAEARREALEKELAVAREIQMSIVPPRTLVATQGGSLIGVLEPASFCGGDFWTYADHGDRLFIFIGDVTGHGVGAAMITTVAKSCLDTIWAHGAGVHSTGQVKLNELMATLNDVIALSARGQLTMTAFALEITRSTRELEYCVAGHNPPYLIRAEAPHERPVSLTSRSARLGDGRGNEFAVTKRAYSPGDRIVLFTDGLVEGLNPAGDEYGARRLARLLQQTKDVSIEQLLTTIETDSKAFFDGVPQEDDIAIIVTELS